MDELRRNLRNGAYKIPRNIELSVECLDFLNSCLRFDSIKRKDWDQLLDHPFLQDSDVFVTNNNPFLAQLRQFTDPGKSLELNARMSYNLYEVYQNILFEKIERRIQQNKPIA